MQPSFDDTDNTGPLAGRTILQIIPSLDAGGAERTTIDIAAALAQAGAHALVASQGGRLVGELQARGGVFIPFPAASKNPFVMAAMVPRLAALLRREKVDIIHARSRAPAWVALGARRLTGLPLVTTWHGAYSGTNALKQLYNSVMARGDVVIANSFYTARHIAALHPFAQDHLAVVHRGTDFQTFAPARVDPARVQAMRHAWGLAPEERVILVAARLSPWKGHEDMIAATSILRRQPGYEDVRVVFAGDPQGRKAIAADIDRAIRQSDLFGIVRRTGHCADMPAAFMAASIVAVPSTRPEAFGRVAVEAQAMGVPVVVTDLGAVPETVLAPPDVPARERTGWRVSPSNPAQLAQALAEALDMGASARDDMARHSRKHVTTHFSLDVMCRKTLTLYGHLLGAVGG